MEKVIAISLEVDNGDSIAELEKLEDNLEEVNELYKEIGNTAEVSTDKADQSLKDLNKTVKAGGKTFGELRTIIEQYKDIAIEAGRNSPVGQEALNKAAILQDQLDGIDAEIRNIAHDGANMQAALQLGQGILAGYTAFQGVTAMLGVENEELIETLTKLQGAQSALMGIEQLRMTLEKESFLMQKAKIIQTKALAAAQLVYTTAIGTSTGALKLFRIALLSTGIGALIVGIGLLIANFDAVKKAAISFGEILIEVFKKIIDPFGLFTNTVTEGEKKMAESMSRAAEERKKAVEKELDANKKRRKDIDKTIDKNREQTDQIEKELQRELELRQANGENTDRLEVDILKGRIERFRVQKDLAKERLRLIMADFKLLMTNGQLTLQQIHDSRQAFAEQLAILKGNSELVIKTQHDLNVKLAQQRTKAREDQKEANKQEIEILDRHLEDVRVKVVAAAEKMPSLIEVPELEAEDYLGGILGRLNEFYEDWQRMDNEAKLAMADSALGYANEVMGSISTIVAAVNQGAEMEVASIEKTKENKLKNERLSALDKYKIEVESAQATDKINKQVFDRNKKLQIAQTAIDGATAVVKTLASVPAPFNFVLAASVAAASLAQLNAIRRTQYQSTATSISPPSFATESTEPTNELNDPSGSLGGSQTYLNSPVVYVSEINDTQQRLRDIDDVGVIGG